MKTIRQGVFETNSSSTHNVSIMSIEEYNRWKDEGLYHDQYNEKFLTKEELFTNIRNENPNEILTEKDILEIIAEDRYEYGHTYEDFFDEEYWLEIDENRYTTKSGEEIVIICKYGRDG